MVIHTWTLYRSLQADRNDAYQVLQAKSVTATKAVQTTLSHGERLLTFLTGRDEIRNMDPVSCSAFLRGLEAIDSMYAVVSVLDLTGQAICISVRGTGRVPASAGKSEWFAKALASETFFLGKPAIGRITGKPVVPLSLLVRDASGATVAVAVVSIDLLQLEELMVGGWTTPSGIVALLDRDFQFLIRSDDTRNWLGKEASGTVKSIRIDRKNPIIEATDTKGVPRIFARTELGEYGLRVAASMPLEDAFGASRTELFKGLGLAGTALLLAGALAFFGARALARPLRSLAGTAREIGDGKETAHADETLPGEFKALAIEMNSMHEARKKSERSARASEMRAQRLSRFYEAVSRTNQAIVRLKEPDELFDTICKVCVETGQASMSWIGLIVGDRLVPVAWGGEAKSFTRVFDLNIAAGRQSMGGPTSAALLDGKSYVANDYVNDPGTVLFRANAAPFEVRASATLPFRRSGAVVGTLNLYAREVGFFSDDVMRLLHEMTSDISFALDNFERAANHQRTIQELARRGSQLSGIVESATDAIVTIDASHRIVVFNEAASRAFKIPVADAIGQRPDRFMPERFRDAHARHVSAFALLGAADDVVASPRQLVGLDGDGLEFPIEVTTFRTFQGPDALITMIIRDVTDEHEAERARASAAESAAASFAKTTFLSRMSHELRTPLNAVLAFSQLLQEGAKDRLSDIERHQLDLIFLAGAQLRALVEDVLDLSIVESGNLSLSFSDFDLKGLLEGVLRMSEALAKASAIKLSSTYAQTGPLPMHTDPVRLRQVVLNLVSNAIKYNRPGGSVTVGIDALPDGVSVSVADTGIGMTEEQLGGLFEPFNRLGRETSSVQGTGIGMALVRQLVVAMGGHTTVVSEVGVGTTVRVHLPRPQRGDLLLKGSEAVEVLPDPPKAPATDLVGLVLYVEDNDFNVQVVRTVLRRWPGVQLVVAVDGKSGIERAAALRPDVILLDIGLPDMSGLEVLHALRTNLATRDLRVIVLSATAMAADVELARAAGAEDYWTKPIELNSFCDGMRTLLETKPSPGVPLLAEAIL